MSEPRADAAYTGNADGDATAIIGLSCRLPHAPDMDAFWRLLKNGEDAITEVPADRWDASAVGAEERRLRYGAFLEQIDQFDAEFFGISPREAATIDPQQRLILELCWEALEDAGIVPARLDGSQTGVFIGAISDDYRRLVDRRGVKAITQHSMTGLHRSIIANRVSYCFGFRGPSLTVDTAQSASLVAVHMAHQSLRTGESALAIAGGVNLNLVTENAVSAARFGSLSPDGRSFTFDARANGYVRGEGGGVVVLKPLASALADGDPIYCVIRGSAVNNDGSGNGLTVPNPAAQQEVVRLACHRAGVNTADVQYVELHGSGTKVGDPIEAAALGEVLGAGRPARTALVVGSAKTNVGHLEGAAGATQKVRTGGLAVSLTSRCGRSRPRPSRRCVPKPSASIAGSMITPSPARLTSVTLWR